MDEVLNLLFFHEIVFFLSFCSSRVCEAELSHDLVAMLLQGCPRKLVWGMLFYKFFYTKSYMNFDQKLEHTRTEIITTRLGIEHQKIMWAG